MSVLRDPDAILAAWLEEGPTRLPDGTRRAIAVNTRTTQRRRQMWMPQRRVVMNPFARFAIVAVVVVAAVGGALYVFAPGGSTVGAPPGAAASPSATPSPARTASPAASTSTVPPSPAALAKDGIVYPGTYVPAFDPPLSFTISREVQHNCAPNFQCRGSIDSNLPAWMDLEFGLPRIEVSLIRVDKVFDIAKRSRVIDAPADLVGWIAQHPGVTVTDQKRITIGGLPATQLDLKIGGQDVAFGPITGVTDAGFGVGANTVSRFIVVDVHGHHVVVALVAEDGSLAELQPLIDSITWD